MIKGKRILAVIPARGGSKGVKNKNIKLLSGKPLVSWTIIEAKKSKYIDKIVVSTDSELIAKTAKKSGAEVPFMRPKKLASDSAKNIDVIIHAVNWLGRNGFDYDAVIILQPTSPLRIVVDIDGLIEYFIRKNADMIVSVCKSEHSPNWANTLPKDKNMNNFIRKNIQNKNRQELQEYFRLNGAAEISKTEYLLNYKNNFGEQTYAYVMPQERSIDIDSEIDFLFSEALIREQRINK